MPSQSNIVCENPSIVLSPNFVELVSVHRNYTINGVTSNIVDKRNIFLYVKTQNFSPRLRHVTVDTLSECYVTDCVTRERYPIYIEVPCGHCRLCKDAKVNSFVQRCELESQLYDCNPIFLTLTYDEEHKPNDGVSVRDVQLFLKRFRINMYRQGFRESIRYVAVGEYGRHTKRPHYHLILWNCQQSDFSSYCKIGEIIKKSWTNGFELHRQVDPSDDKAFYYTAKYLRKDCDLPEGCNKTFLVSSNRGGGIGSRFIDLLSLHVIDKLDTHPQYVNKFNSKVKDLQLSKYVLNRIFPSFCRSVSPSLRTHVRNFIIYSKVLECRSDVNASLFDSKALDVIKFFGRYFYCPVLKYSDISEKYNVSTNEALRILLEAEIHIDRAMQKGHDYFLRCMEIDKKRKRFLELLFSHQREVPLAYRSYLSYHRDIVSPYEVL